MDFKVTPWDVEGIVDYQKLIEQFGTTPIDEAMLKRIKKNFGELHLFLRRKIFFSHRDFDMILDRVENNQRYALYTGRGPSGHTHLGHIMPWIFTKYLQDKTGANLYFQITDDEKFLHSRELSLEDTKEFAYQNILDIIAVGFDPEKTFMFLDTEYAKTLYNIAIKVAERITFSTVKAVFGFENSTNIGMIFYPSIQAAPCFLPSELGNEKMPVLIPAAIDQDPYWRVTRDVAEKLGYHKPTAIHCSLLPSLEGPSGKMSASKPDSAIFTVDTKEDVKRKVGKAFTGGKKSLKEQKEHGGNPEICSVFQYLYYLFEEDDKAIEERREACLSGDMVCGECKAHLTKKIAEFLKEHQKKREKARDTLEEFILRD
ncbi:MAG: tryptophan--tRNA ligase [Euryarchaeota archaeon]|nr:tryptophan--tRNA ligase [Euryarchaeota archaeon]